MDYNTMLNVIRITGRVPLAKANNLVNQLIASAINYGWNEEDDEQISTNHPYVKLYELIVFFLQQEVFVGDEDDFHNIAVSLANNDDYDYACEFLERGLVKYPYSMDLLADYLKYCINVNIQKGKDYSERLNSIDKTKWNWRAFQFSYEYLKALSVKDGLTKKEEITNIIEMYKKYTPGDDAAYAIEYDYIRETGGQQEKNDAKQRLIALVEDELGFPKRCSLCSARLLKEYFNDKKYEQCLNLIKRCFEDSVEEYPKVNRIYVYFISILCRVSILFQKHGVSMAFDNDDESSANLVRMVYKEANVVKALEYNRESSSLYGKIKGFIQEIEKLTKIPFVDDIDLM